MSDLKPVRIEGQLFWAKWMKEHNTKFNDTNNKYECTVGMISDDDAAKLTGLGIKVKNKEIMGNYIVAKSQFMFKPVDDNDKEVDIDQIGNGTKVNVLLTSYTHKMSKMHGNAPSIKKIWVKEIVTYVPPEESLEDIAL